MIVGVCGTGRISKREQVLKEWNEILAKAEKRLADSITCNKEFGDNEDWVKEDTERVETIKRKIKEITAFMDEHNIQ